MINSINISIYINLGFFDALAVLVLMFKIYRLPMREYQVSIIVMSLAITGFSFFNRVILEMPEIDLPLQMISFILFSRYVIKIKYFYSTLITSMGLCSYIILQLTIYLFLTNTGLIDHEIVTQLGGWSVYLVQVTTILFAYLIAILLKSFNLGFSFVVIPPNDFDIKEDYINVNNRWLLVVNIVGLILVSITLVFILNQNALLIFPFALSASWLLYYYSKRRDLA